jgi:hypothetical protein
MQAFSLLCPERYFRILQAGDAMSESFPSLLLLILTVVSWYFRPLDRKIIPVKQLNSIA